TWVRCLQRGGAQADPAFRGFFTARTRASGTRRQSWPQGSLTTRSVMTPMTAKETTGRTRRRTRSEKDEFAPNDSKRFVSILGIARRAVRPSRALGPRSARSLTGYRSRARFPAAGWRIRLTEAASI